VLLEAPGRKRGGGGARRPGGGGGGGAGGGGGRGGRGGPALGRTAWLVGAPGGNRPPPPAPSLLIDLQGSADATLTADCRPPEIGR